MWIKRADLTTRIAWLIVLLPAALVTWLSLQTLLHVEPATDPAAMPTPQAVEIVESRSAAPAGAPGVSPHAFLRSPLRSDCQPQVVTPPPLVEWLPVVDVLPTARVREGAADPTPSSAVLTQPVIQAAPLPTPAAPAAPPVAPQSPQDDNPQGDDGQSGRSRDNSGRGNSGSGGGNSGSGGGNSGSGRG